MASIRDAVSVIVSLLMQNTILVILALIIIRLLRNKFQHGLVDIPGPKLAAYTRLWRVYSVGRGSAHLDAIALHKKHGNLVRIAPNVVQVADPKWISVFCTAKEEYTKTAYYPIQSITWKKRPAMNLFSTRDPDFHRAQKRKVGHIFSLPKLLESEAAIDSCVDLFMSKLNLLSGEPIDLGAWLQYFAFDVVGEISFASKLGFLDHGTDVRGIIAAIEGMLAYSSICGQVPELHHLLVGNPILTELMPAMELWNQVLIFTLKAANARTSSTSDDQLIDGESIGKDMLSHFARIRGSDPNKLNTQEIVCHLSSNVFAGSDTTAIALRAMVYFLCRNPACMAKLVAEIDRADETGLLSHPIQYKEASKLPYLQGVMKESMRLHPSVGLLLERHVPAQGVEIDGYFLKAGTIVGINPWVTSRDADAFPEPTVFKPERWFEASENKLKIMDNLWEFNFGAGARKCIGRHISWIEMTKVIPEMLRHFTIELTEPKNEWRVTNHWFVRQEGVICNLKRRS